MDFRGSDAVIRFCRVWCGYNGRHALKDVSFVVREGECVAITGRNGAGKSTLLKACLGLIRPERGFIEVLGRRLADCPPEELRRIRTRLGYVPQTSNIRRRTSVIGAVIQGAIGGPNGWRCWHPILSAGADLERAREELTSLGIYALRWRGTHSLSGGELRRVSIATALVNKPKVILADEPEVGLDESFRELAMRRLLTNTGYGHPSAVLVTHDLCLASRYANRILVLDDGVIDGPLKEKDTDIA